MLNIFRAEYSFEKQKIRYGTLKIINGIKEKTRTGYTNYQR